MLGSLFTFLKILFPFLRESVFRGQSFKKWIARHARELLYLGLLGIMMMICYSLFTMATKAHHQLQIALGNQEDMDDQLKDLQKSLNSQRLKLKALTDANVLLTKRVKSQDAQIAQYQQWMDACGMDYRLTDTNGKYPICNGIIVVHGPRPTPKKGPTKPARHTPAPDNAELTDRVKDIWKSHP